MILPLIHQIFLLARDWSERSWYRRMPPKRYSPREIFFCSLSRTRKHSKEHIPRGIQQAVLKIFFTRVAKYLNDNKHNRLYKAILQMIKFLAGKKENTWRTFEMTHNNDFPLKFSIISLSLDLRTGTKFATVHMFGKTTVRLFGEHGTKKSGNWACTFLQQTGYHIVWSQEFAYVQLFQNYSITGGESVMLPRKWPPISKSLKNSLHKGGHNNLSHDFLLKWMKFL